MFYEIGLDSLPDNRVGFRNENGKEFRGHRNPILASRLDHLYGEIWGASGFERFENPQVYEQTTEQFGLLAVDGHKTCECHIISTAVYILTLHTAQRRAQPRKSNTRHPILPIRTKMEISIYYTIMKNLRGRVCRRPRNSRSH